MFSQSADFQKTTCCMNCGLAIFYKTEKTGVAQHKLFSRTFLIKCQGQIEAMGHRIISCFCQQNVLTGNLPSYFDFLWGVPPFSIFSCIFIKNQGIVKSNLSFYFWDKLLFWANTLQSRQGITLGRHNAVGA